MITMPLVELTIAIGARQEPIALHDLVWQALEEIAAMEKMELPDLVSAVDRARDDEDDLVTALEVLAVSYFRHAATEAGHQKAGHGSGQAVRRYLSAIVGGIARHPIDRD